MGYRFSLVLSREITDEESVALKEAGCSAAVFGTDCLPTNTEVTVTKMEFDDTASRSLADAIESALEAVKQVPNLSVPGLTVPAQPAGPLDEEPKVVSGEVIEEAAAEVTGQAAAEVTEEKPAAKKAARKPGAKRPSSRKPAAPKTSAPQKAEVSAES